MANLVGDTLLNINDIGGQPGFLEMLPALSTGPAIVSIVGANQEWLSFTVLR